MPVLENPLGLCLLGLLAPLIALYLLKVRRRRIEVPSTWLWSAVRRDLASQSPFRKLTWEVPLILQALAIALLALAVSRPVAPTRASVSQHLAIVIDTSASMQARSGSTTRISEALLWARELILGLPPASDALIIEAGRDARIASSLDTDKRRLQKALDAVDATDVEGRLAPAIALATARLKALPGRKHIAVITDGALTDPEALTGTALPLEVHRVGKPVDNTAVVAIDVRSAVDPITQRERVETFALVETFGASRRDVFVTLRQRNVVEPLASRRVQLTPGEPTPVVLGFDAAPGDAGSGLVVEISPPDALTADDRAYARVPPRERLPVVVAPPNANPWILRALRADRHIEVLESGVQDLGNIPDEALVVVDGACPALISGGDRVIINPPPGPCGTAEVGAKIDGPAVTSWSQTDPRLRYVSFDGVFLLRARHLELDSPSQGLVQTGSGPIIADASLRDRTTTLLSFDPSDSNWPLTASFVVFLRNLVEMARTHRLLQAHASARTGEPLQVHVPVDVSHATVEDPRGASARVPARAGEVLVPELSASGFYSLSWQGAKPGSALIAANLTSPSESNLSDRDSRQTDWLGPGPDAKVALRASEPTPLRELGFLPGAVALGFIVLDVWWLTRRRTYRPLPGKTERQKSAWWRRPALVTLIGLGFLPLTVVLLQWVSWLDESRVRIERPWLSLVAAAAMLFLAKRLLALPESHGPCQKGPKRRLLTELALGFCALAAAFAILGVELGRPFDRFALLVAIDRSRSMDLVPQVESRVSKELEVAELGMRADDRIATLAFGVDAAVETPMRPRSRRPAQQAAVVSRDGTDLERAIRQSLAEVPPDLGARIVLITDGVSTRGDPLAAAAAALAAGVPVDAVPLDQSRVPDVRLVGVRTASEATPGEALELQVTIDSPKKADIELRISENGLPIGKSRATVGPGEEVVRLRQVARNPGLYRYDVELSALDPKNDQAPEDNQDSAFVRVRGQSKALVISRDHELAEPLVHSLQIAAFGVDTVGALQTPEDVASYANYELVALCDIAASEFSPTQLEAIAAYVRELGGGLLLMGSDRAYGPGGYGKTPIEDISPVSFDLKQERRRASLAEVIAVDYSGSMSARAGTRSKLDLANEAAARSAQLLGAGDQLGVMHVDTHVRWTLPIAPVVDHADIAQRIVSVQPGGGGIYVDLALVNAYQALEARSSNLKHLLLFADGDDAEERERAFMLVQNARARNITTSVVALGQGKDVAALERMSQLGNGRFYLIQDASRLLAVFAQETILAARSALHEAPFRAQPGAPSAATRGIDFSMAPELGGYVVTIRKPRAEVLLHAVEGDPLLATWSIGLGRSAAFSSDYSFRWGAKWSTWDGAAQLFGQLAREIARRPEDPRVRLDASIDAGQLKVVLNAVDEDQRAESFRRFEAHVAGPGGFATRLALDPVAAGVYSARLPLPRPGAYVVSAIDQQSSQVAATTGAVLSRGQELVSTGTDRALLRKVAELSGGKLRDTLAGVFEDRPARRASYQDITALLFSIAAFSLLFGVSVRRLALPLDRPDGQGRLSTVPKRWLGLLAAAQPRTAQESVDEPVTQSTEPVPNASATPEPGLYPQSAAAILVARRRARTRR